MKACELFSLLPFQLCLRSATYILQTNFANYPKGEILRDAFRELLGDGTAPAAVLDAL